MGNVFAGTRHAGNGSYRLDSALARRRYSRWPSAPPPWCCRASGRHCGVCTLKPNCCPNMPSRRVPRSPSERGSNCLFCRIFSTQTGVHFAGKCSRQGARTGHYRLPQVVDRRLAVIRSLDGVEVFRGETPVCRRLDQIFGAAGAASIIIVRLRPRPRMVPRRRDARCRPGSGPPSGRSWRAEALRRGRPSGGAPAPRRRAW